MYFGQDGFCCLLSGGRVVSRSVGRLVGRVVCGMMMEWKFMYHCCCWVASQSVSEQAIATKTMAMISRMMKQAEAGRRSCAIEEVTWTTTKFYDWMNRAHDEMPKKGRSTSWRNELFLRIKVVARLNSDMGQNNLATVYVIGFSVTENLEGTRCSLRF